VEVDAVVVVTEAADVAVVTTIDVEALLDVAVVCCWVVVAVATVVGG
jgi:hypothetical protein